MNKKELLKENCTYKLFLISLLENFKETQKSINDISFKKYIKHLERVVEEVLELKDDKKINDIYKLFDKEYNNE